MRNRALHDALRDFTLEAAGLLSSEVQKGDEIEFELFEEPGSGPILYRYRPLTEQYIGERWESLRDLPSCTRAAAALGSGAEAYLRVHGVSDNGTDAEPALRAMLERLWDDATNFGFPEERFERVYADLERTLYEGTLQAAVVASMPGVELERERVELGDGLVLVAGRASEAPPEAVWPLPGDRDRGAAPNTICMLERDVPSDAPAPVTEARVRFRRLLTAMRLFKSGGVALGPLAWMRSDAGPWQPLPLAPSGYARGEPWLLGAAEEAGLRELLGVLERTRGGPAAWALARFEMGCERALDTEALSDYLLAARALLTREEENDGSFVLRLAALCAEEPDRPAVQRRIEGAITLERFVMGGAQGEEYMESVGPTPPHEIVLALEDFMRALLQDVLCGYLDPDLRTLADEILLTSGEHVEIEARDLRDEPAEGIPDGLAEEIPDGPPAVIPDPPDSAHPVDAEADTAEHDEPSTDELEPVPEGPVADEPIPDDDSGVTPCADWDGQLDLDEEAASYSAPV